MMFLKRCLKKRQLVNDPLFYIKLDYKLGDPSPNGALKQNDE